LPLSDLKFLIEFSTSDAGTLDRRNQALMKEGEQVRQEPLPVRQHPLPQSCSASFVPSLAATWGDRAAAPCLCLRRHRCTNASQHGSSHVSLCVFAID